MAVISELFAGALRTVNGLGMRRWCVIAAWLLFFALNSNADERLNFNPGWKFTKSDPPGAAQPSFDDHDWTDVSAPHTFNDTDTFDDWSLAGHRGEQNQWSGRTWYRKTFTLPQSYKNRKVFVEFEAVRQVGEIYLNGKLLGVSRTGFTPFGFDLTPHLRFDGPNVLAVMCDNRFMKDPPASNGNGEDAVGHGENGGPTLSQLSARVNASIPDNIEELDADHIPWNNPHWHPAHGGIYRNVYLHVTDPLHLTLPLYSFLQTAGPYAYATEVSDKSARISIEMPVQNERTNTAEIELRSRILDADGRVALDIKQAGVVTAGGNATFTLQGVLVQPKLWEPNYPFLYRVVCSVAVNGHVVDTSEVPLGIRIVQWDAQRGFFINGNHLKLRGWGQKPTDEWPGLGAAQPNWLHFFTINLMKQAGGNFLRWGHSAAGPASIVAADDLGLIVDQPGVDGESDTRGAAWKVRASAFRDTIIYFRNHPSILVWEGGNQKVTREHAAELRGLVNEYDPHGGRVYAHRRADQRMAEFIDVGIGTEGGRELGNLPVLEGEYDREESPRRVWDDLSPPNYGYPEGKGQTYQLTSEQYAINQVTQFVRKLGSVDHCGGANWIFSDSTSGGRVSTEVARASGEVDGVRLPKEAYYVCQAMFRFDPQVHIVGHWTYPSGTKKTVHVVSNGDAVELFLNGKSLGRAEATDRYLFTFPDIAWQPGELKAVAYLNGKQVTSDTRRTAGPAVRLRLTPVFAPGGWSADGSDVLLLDVEAVDAKGERCPTFQQRVDFAVRGPGVWRGGYNSGKTNSINNTFLDLECGINRVAVRSTRQAGQVTIQATAPGLKSGNVSVRSVPCEVVNGIASRLPAWPETQLPKTRTLEVTSLHPAPQLDRATSDQRQAGRFTRAFSYSGPTTIVHVERNAQLGKNVYVDCDLAMSELPPELVGADWVQAANADSLYHAVDLMELSVPGGVMVWVAHDDRLPRPEWLTNLFSETSSRITISGRTRTLFRRHIRRDESLTLGPNVDNTQIKSAEMYVVFVTPELKASATQARKEGN